ncbi:hypothetical protein Ciccas_001786 [Cichlidogyrus casuarinus]|uniref:Uncharacterized protein n=1 Tax=Cichlidogyrus casuarinus TaxID=1844966 RepID=A0ABD2QJ65_9PLAT
MKHQSLFQHFLYLFVLTQLAITIVLPICDAFFSIIHKAPHDHKYYREVWLILQYLGGILSLAYLQMMIIVYEVRTKRLYIYASMKRTRSLPESPEIKHSSDAATFQEIDDIDVAIGDSYLRYKPNADMQNHNFGLFNRIIRCIDETCFQKTCFVNHSRWKNTNKGMAYLSWHPQGLNLYMRLGAVGFGFGVMIYDGFNLLSYLQNEMNRGCFSHAYIPKTIIHFVFVLWQTYFVFKYHRLVINVSSFVVSLAFTHLAIVNFGQWLKVIVAEVQADFSPNCLVSNVSSQQIDEYKSYTDILALFSTYTRKALYPITVQYSIIVGMLFFKMLYRTRNSLMSSTKRNIFRASGPSAEHEPNSEKNATSSDSLESKKEMSKKSKNVSSLYDQELGVSYEVCEKHSEYTTMCGRKVYVPIMPTDAIDKPQNSLFAGLVLFIASCVALVIFIYYIRSQKKYDQMKAMHVYQYSKIMVLTLALFAAIGAIRQTSKLHYRGLNEEDSFEYNLLSIGFTGNFIYYLFLLVPAFEDSFTPNHSDVAELYVAKCFLEIFQSLCQFFLLVEVARRGPCCLQQSRIKPGRSLVIFLLISNLTLWLMNTVEVRRADLAQSLHQGYFGVNGWNIITCCLIPLIIFYRFHSTVCLADIWCRCFIKTKHKYKCSSS